MFYFIIAAAWIFQPVTMHVRPHYSGLGGMARGIVMTSSEWPQMTRSLISLTSLNLAGKMI